MKPYITDFDNLIQVGYAWTGTVTVEHHEPKGFTMKTLQEGSTTVIIDKEEWETFLKHFGLYKKEINPAPAGSGDDRK